MLSSAIIYLGILLTSATSCQHGSLFQNPLNCSTFFQCNWGQSILQACPTGLHFNSRISVCDWPVNANCHDTSVPVKPNPDIQCYTCTYVEKSDFTDDGCELKTPPSKYKRNDCFGFNNLQIAGAIRHSNASKSSFGQNGNDNTHCVKISGKTDNGNLVVLRGCENLPSNEVYRRETCFSKKEYEFPLPGFGFGAMVRNVEKCYCKGSSCFGSNAGARATDMMWSLYPLHILLFVTVYF